ncbi:protein-methionine-sulfoxide reductase catalytic subunit MsrP [Aestuariibacter sp. AA17]|uniref:Protein-methionine-sulfoxide reductase catalytic subunit MsrP n=1 Tax=Fluctibacter corallii TaxID=2984329 RepID=A0ABT3AAK6_9ALTE|nr:protein-methionine-sulfoxide reductase catalytic subunit MsrP [Aestuariibacter sp. AA17]MCV2885705.1 protein-methionine-sulfoxide reductase catalytic subunit MsrP [Aestuariibacter sp. AA17]
MNNKKRAHKTKATTPGKITPKHLFLTRREVIKGAIALGLLPACSKPNIAPSPDVTPQSLVSSYCNYYEFSRSKEAVKILAQALTLNPWQVDVTGLVDTPYSIDVSHVSSLFTLHSRTYSLRCVEGWSAVIPWQGILLKDVISRANPKPEAKFVKFIGHFDPKEMIGQRRQILQWPYTEGLRLDEALHPLTLLATGMYSGAITPENGAPLRLVVPWKYGYKSIKAIRRIELVSYQPLSSWQQMAPSEYGFFANVNPDVPHPRWSQRRELPLGETQKRATQLLNGYADDVQHLYTPDILNSLS